MLQRWGKPGAGGNHQKEDATVAPNGDRPRNSGSWVLPTDQGRVDSALLGRVPMRIGERCFKIDKPNAKAMIEGFWKNGKRYRQAIWLAVYDFPFPALITLQRARSPFQLSVTGRAMDAEEFMMPLRYAAVLAGEYFVDNVLPLWETLCRNTLFDIWSPVAPYTRFAQAESHPSKYRIMLLRVYEIDHTFRSGDIEHASSRIDRLVNLNRDVGVIAPVIPDDEFTALTKLLEESVSAYLLREPRRYRDMTVVSPGAVEIAARQDIESSELENQFFEGERVPRLSSYYERNPQLRAATIRHHGTSCTICMFCFGESYGPRGQGFIEVHHLTPVSQLVQSRFVDPKTEMTVVCANCHRMIHRKRDAILTPAQVVGLLRERRTTTGRSTENLA
jgi:hypothetical protein